MKIKVGTIGSVGLFICLVYILLRPFLNTYVTEYVKYVFITVMLFYAIKGLSSKRVTKEIGFVELLLCTLVICYVMASSLFVGGIELAIYSLERYVFYLIPLLVVPVIRYKVNWFQVLKFLSWYGVADASVSIAEFIIHKQLVPIAGVTHSVVQQYGDNSIRTFGLNGDYFLLAELLCLCGFASLCLYCTHKSKLDLVKFLVILTGIFTTGSRGYYVSFFVGISVFFVLYNYDKGITLSALLKVLMFLFGSVLLLIFVFMTDISLGIDSIDIVLDRARSITDFASNKANVDRLQLWEYALDKWLLEPFWGNGASLTDERFSGFEKVTESGLLKRLVELGVVGTMIQYASMVVPLYKGCKRFKCSIDKKNNLLMIFFFSEITMLLVEDFVLQRYGEIEYSIVIWTALAFVSTYKINDKKVLFREYL